MLMASTMMGQFHFFAAGMIRRYEATEAAVTLVGHEGLMEFIEQALGHETGAIRQANVDWIPLEADEQLVILRDQGSGRIVVFLESERELLFPWVPAAPT